jgi:hypothetical protein
MSMVLSRGYYEECKPFLYTKEHGHYCWEDEKRFSFKEWITAGKSAY